MQNKRFFVAIYSERKNKDLSLLNSHLQVFTIDSR